MLPVLAIAVPMLHIHIVVLELLERVLRVVSHPFHPRRMHLVRWEMSVRHHVVGRYGIVCRVALEWVRQHADPQLQLG